MVSYLVPVADDLESAGFSTFATNFLLTTRSADPNTGMHDFRHLNENGRNSPLSAPRRLPRDIPKNHAWMLPGQRLSSFALTTSAFPRRRPMATKPSTGEGSYAEGPSIERALVRMSSMPSCNETQFRRAEKTLAQEAKMTDFDQQLEKMRAQPGFIAALDQSGGSTPGALRLYGVNEGAWSNEEEMYTLVHQMRTRVITSPSFTGERILGAILFENTMDRTIEGQLTADYLWKVKRVVPFLKVDKGLESESNGVQMMKPMPALSGLLDKAKSKRIFGTKMRSVVKKAVPEAINNVVRQQFEVAAQILKFNLVPIVEPEVDIRCPDKAKAEALLKSAVLEKLNALPQGQRVMLKLTLPEQPDFYLDFVNHPKVLRVVALSGGYTREDANDRLRRNHGIVASFSRALLEGLTAQQSESEFDKVLGASIKSIYDASVNKTAA